MISSWLNRSHKNQCHQFGTPNNISATLAGVALFVVDEDNKVVENPALFAPGSYVPNIYGYYYDNVYKPYIDSHIRNTNNIF